MASGRHRAAGRRDWLGRARQVAAAAALAALCGCAAPSPPAPQSPNALPAPTGAWPTVEPERAGRHACLALTPAPGQTSVDQSWAAATSIDVTVPGDINLDWSAVEPTPGTWIDPDGVLATSSRLYAEADAVSLTLAPIQTNAVRVPDDLSGRRWDDPELVARYLAALDAVLWSLRDVRVETVSVGNEVDGVLATDGTAWQAYAGLVGRVRSHLAPRGIEVGAKLTWEGAQSDAAAPVVAASDLVIVSYYPLGVGAAPYQVRPPEVVADELEKLLAQVAPRPVDLAEAGYPSDPSIGGSPQRQAAFVDAVYDVWDRHPSQLRGVCLVWSDDLSADTAATLVEQYGITDPGFAAYLGSLGLRDVDGRGKPAWARLADRAGRLR